VRVINFCIIIIIIIIIIIALFDFIILSSGLIRALKIYIGLQVISTSILCVILMDQRPGRRGLGQLCPTMSAADKIHHILDIEQERHQHKN